MVSARYTGDGAHRHAIFAENAKLRLTTATGRSPSYLEESRRGSARGQAPTWSLSYYFAAAQHAWGGLQQDALSAQQGADSPQHGEPGEQQLPSSQHGEPG